MKITINAVFICISCFLMMDVLFLWGIFQPYLLVRQPAQQIQLLFRTKA